MIVVYSDLHLYGVNPTYVAMTFGPEAYYVGDIYDIKNARRSEVEQAKTDMNRLRSIVGERYVSGEHELEFFNVFHPRNDGVLFTHGDSLFWHYGRIDKARNKRAGAFAIERFVKKWLDKIRTAMPECWRSTYIDQEFLEMCRKAGVKFGCHTIVCGHHHQPHKLDLTYAGVRIIIVPRGKTIIGDL